MIGFLTVLMGLLILDEKASNFINKAKREEESKKFKMEFDAETKKFESNKLIVDAQLSICKKLSDKINLLKLKGLENTDEYIKLDTEWTNECNKYHKLFSELLY